MSIIHSSFFQLMYLLNTSDAFVKLCQSGEFSDFFTLPPDSPTDIAVVEDAFCSTNLTLVLAELDEKFKFSEIAYEVSKHTYVEQVIRHLLRRQLLLR